MAFDFIKLREIARQKRKSEHSAYLKRTKELEDSNNAITLELLKVLEEELERIDLSGKVSIYINYMISKFEKIPQFMVEVLTPNTISIYAENMPGDTVEINLPEQYLKQDYFYLHPGPGRYRIIPIIRMKACSHLKKHLSEIFKIGTLPGIIAIQPKFEMLANCKNSDKTTIESKVLEFAKEKYKVLLDIIESSSKLGATSVSISYLIKQDKIKFKIVLPNYYQIESPEHFMNLSTLDYSLEFMRIEEVTMILDLWRYRLYVKENIENKRLRRLNNTSLIILIK